MQLAENTACTIKPKNADFVEAIGLEAIKETRKNAEIKVYLVVMLTKSAPAVTR